METDELREVILQIGLAEPVIELEKAPNGKVGGFVISKSFVDRTQSERQTLIWNEFKKRLSPEMQLQIMSILTLTPDEAGLAA